MSALTALTFAIAVLTPPRSGPFCRLSACVGSPYTDIAAFFPRDYGWMYPATLLALVVVACMACVHDYAAAAQKRFGLLALVFAAMAAAVLATDYGIQLMVIQPSLRAGELAGLGLLSQYNPHGVFIALESVGYLLLSVAFGFAAPVFAGGAGLERALRWVFAAGCALALIGMIGFSLGYGQAVEYRFEVYVISIDWLALIGAGALLSAIFRRGRR
ncbi:MAG TPA: hypothetical protein VGE07_22735 [Herpetosiphonaceae bacterium]